MQVTPAAGGDAGPGAGREWMRNWPLVVSCMIGVAINAVAPYSLGQFMAPLEREFGWSRTESAGALSIGLLFGVLLAPPIGRLVDRVNARVVALPGLIFIGAVIAAFSLANGSLGLWLLLWTLHAAAAAMIGPAVWVTVVSGTFEKGRSLAVAVALSGSSLSTAFAPSVARYLIDAYQWRDAWRLIGVGWAGVAFIVAFFFFRDRRPREKADAASPKPVTPLRALFLSSVFLRLALVVFGGMMVISASLIHLSPALVDEGFDPKTAAKIAGVAGLAILVGKFAVAGALDRAPMVVVSTVVLGALGLSCLLLAIAHGAMLPAVIGSAGLGAASGGLLMLAAAITSRLFKAEDFGAVFGGLMSMVSLGGGLGPIAASRVHDTLGAYTPALWVGVGVAAVCALVVATLPAQRPA